MKLTKEQMAECKRVAEIMLEAMDQACHDNIEIDSIENQSLVETMYDECYKQLKKQLGK